MVACGRNSAGIFEHLRRSLDAYMPHKYELTLSGRADKCAEQAFLVDPVAREDCLPEFKDCLLEVVDFLAIFTQRGHMI